MEKPDRRKEIEPVESKTEAESTVRPDPEVPEKPRRRHFSAEYKLRILREADAVEGGELGAFLRREGLYSSHLSVWRRQREDGSLEGLAPKKRGRKGKPKDPLAERNAELERENRKLKKRLEQAETIIEFQKKVSEILGIPLKSPESEESDS
jgi:transposase-like protein